MFLSYFHIMKPNIYLPIIVVFIVGVMFSGCAKDPELPGNKLEPAIRSGAELLVAFDDAGEVLLPDLITIADASDNLIRPNDVAFSTARENELWIINERNEQIGGSTVMIRNPGDSNQYFDDRVDGNAWHFMSLPTALAWSDNGNWASSPGVKDANHMGGTFTGPTLWSGDLNIYARPSGGNGSHLDMLHGSPYSMGIEAETGNIFWVFDGWNEQLVKYDFKRDHGPGNAYHGDGEVYRYTDIELTRHPSIPSHMRFDDRREWLYICETAKNRIIRVKAATAIAGQDLPLINEDLAVHREMKGAVMEVFADRGLTAPCGIEIYNGTVYVTDNESGEIIAFEESTGKEIVRIDTGNSGLTGICFGNGHLWFVNKPKNLLVRIDPKS